MTSVDTSPIVEQFRETVESRLRALYAEVKQLERVRAALDEPDALDRLAGLAGPLGTGAVEATPADDARPPADTRRVNGAAVDDEAEAKVTSRGSSATKPSAQRREHRGSKRGADGRAPVGYNKQRIFALVQERPGITVAEIAKELGLGRNLTSTTINRYKRAGQLEPHGDGIRVIPVDDAAES